MAEGDRARGSVLQQQPHAEPRRLEPPHLIPPEEADALYDERYYQTSCGAPYARSEPWTTFFGHVADVVVRAIAPRTVLDAGCAMGFLVEALRDRGVEAFGVDVSRYAIGCVRDDIKPYCWVGSVLDPFPRRYDLIVCIEVLEHLTPAQADPAVANLGRHADDVLFSSTPDDFTEPTHQNVQPLDYWAALFAQHGLYRDADFDRSFPVKHAQRFRRLAQPIPEVIRAYERRLWAQLAETEAELAEARGLAERLRAVEAELAGTTHRLGAVERAHAASEADRRGLRDQLVAMENTLGWVALQRLRVARDRFLPGATRRRRLYTAGVSAIRFGLRHGPRPFLRKAWARLLFAARVAAGPRDVAPPPGFTRPLRRVLIVSGTAGAMERYRCRHLAEQFALAGIAAEVAAGTPAALTAGAGDVDLVVIHRLPHGEDVDRLVRHCRRQRRLVLFDIDDLVFDPQLVDSIQAYCLLPEGEKPLFMSAARGYRRTLEMCDAALVTTEALAAAVKREGTPAWVHRNALSAELIELSNAAACDRERRQGRVVIGYASGSRTHDRDFQEIERPLLGVMERHPETELMIVGELSLGPAWDRFAGRITRRGFVPWRELPRWLAAFDINLAPLERGNRFTEAKSELKYLEAAVVGVPTVASRTPPFESAVRDGQNGALATAETEWSDWLERLVTDQSLRATLGARARGDVLARYHPATLADELLVSVRAILRTLGDGSLEIPEPAPPPAPASGGAVFREHRLAHALLDGMRGLEIGAGAHNPFGLQTRNVALPEANAFYAEHARQELGVDPTGIDIEAPADKIPLADGAEDFIISSHVVEHLPNPIGALLEWDRIVRDRGYVFMIVPHAWALPADRDRPLTTLDHIVDDYGRGETLDSHPVTGVSGGRMGHYHTFTPDSMAGVVRWMVERGLCDWELVVREDVDTKVGNGFTLVYLVRHQSR